MTMNITAVKTAIKAKHSNKVLLGFFGVSLAAFAAGFDACLFDIDQAGDCVAHAASWIEPFKAVGDHLIEWASAIVEAAFSQA